jgi:hypothetical protein
LPKRLNRRRFYVLPGKYGRTATNNVCPISFNDGEEIGMPEIIAKKKTDKGIAEFFNEATRAVTMKHRKYSATSEGDVFTYFFHMREYYLLSLNMKLGVDVSQWVEGRCPFERYRRWQVEGKVE